MENSTTLLRPISLNEKMWFVMGTLQHNESTTKLRRCTFIVDSSARRRSSVVDLSPKRCSFVLMLRHSDIEILHPYDVAGRRNCYVLATKLRRNCCVAATSQFPCRFVFLGRHIDVILRSIKVRNCDESTTPWRGRRFVVCLESKLPFQKI